MMAAAELRRLLVDPTTGQALCTPAARARAGTSAHARAGTGTSADARAGTGLDAQPRRPDTCADLRADDVVRPPVGDPAALRRALLAMVPGRRAAEGAAGAGQEWVEPQHDPSAALARAVRLRDRSCDGIGCSVPAERCQLDHDVPWPAGPTSYRNLRVRSQRCHHAKHAGWTVLRLPEGGSRWTSPGGRRYLVPTRVDPPPAIGPGQVPPDPGRLVARDIALLDAGPDDALRLPWSNQSDW